MSKVSYFSQLGSQNLDHFQRISEGEQKMKQNQIIQEEVNNVHADEDASNVEGSRKEFKSVAVDLSTKGDLKIDSGGGKPSFKKVTAAKIQKVELRQATEKNKDGYFSIFLQVTFEHQKEGAEPTVSYETYGGGRLYLSENGGEERFWIGKNSALGRLGSLMEQTFDFSGLLKEYDSLLIGKRVGLLTETTTVGGNEYTKNMINSFLL